MLGLLGGGVIAGIFCLLFCFFQQVLVVELFAELEEVGCGSTKACGWCNLAGPVAGWGRRAERLSRCREDLGGSVGEVGADRAGSRTVEDLLAALNG
jgi:hypothetical protein